MLSWLSESLIEDGRSMSDIKQGVTLEVMGEGTSMGPLSDAMKKSRDTILSTADIKYDIEWTTLGEYSNFWNARAWRPMSPLSSVHPPCASTPRL